MSDKPTPAEAEATSDTVSFDFFDRSWSVPSKVRLSHLRAMRADPSNVGIVDAFLTPDDVTALDKIDPTSDELDAFTDAILEAQGLKSAGNS